MAHSEAASLDRKDHLECLAIPEIWAHLAILATLASRANSAQWDLMDNLDNPVKPDNLVSLVIAVCLAQMPPIVLARHVRLLLWRKK